MQVKRRMPSPAMVVGCIALFLALGGTGYAASRIVSPAPPQARQKRHKRSQKALIKAAVAKYIAGHRKELVGPQGLAGKKGDIGPQGDPGQAGSPGVAGLPSVTAKLAGPVSTGSSTHVALGGPEVTVNVGPSGLVAYWIRAKLKSVGGGVAEVWLNYTGGWGAQLQTPSSNNLQLYSVPGSDSGTLIFNTGLSTVYVGSGQRTLSLEYADTAGTGSFEDMELVVVPL